MTPGEDEKLKQQLRLEAGVEASPALEQDQQIAEYSTDRLDEIADDFNMSAQKQVVALEEGSGLSQEDIEEVRADFDLKNRLANMSTDVRKLVDDYKLKILAGLGKYSHSMNRRAENMKYDRLESKIKSLIETDLEAAVRAYQEAASDDKFYDKAQLKALLEKSGREQLDSALSVNLDTALAFYRNIPKGDISDIIALRLAGNIREQLNRKELEPEDIKARLADHPMLVREIRNTRVYGGEKIYSTGDLAEIVQNAIAHENIAVVNEYIEEIHYHSSYPEYAKLLQENEFVGILFNFLIKNRNYQVIVSRFDVYRELFDKLSDNEKNLIVKTLLAENPRTLNVLKDSVELTEAEKRAIVDSWVEEKNYQKLLNKNNRLFYNIDQETEQKAIEWFIDKSPGYFLVSYKHSLELNLTPEQKQRVKESVFKELKESVFKKLDDKELAYLLTDEAIADFSLTDEEIAKVYGSFIRNAHHSRELGNEQAIIKLGPLQQGFLLKRLLDKAQLNPLVRNLLEKDVATQDMRRPFDVLAKLSRFNVGNLDFNVELKNDPVVSRFEYHHYTDSKAFEQLGDEIPLIFEDPEVFEYFMNDSELRGKWYRNREVIAQLPEEFFKTKVIEIVCDFPEHINDVIDVLQREPALLERPGLLQIATSKDKKDALLDLFQNNQDLSDRPLSALIDRAAGNLESSERLVEIAHLAPELMDPWYVSDWVIEHYDELQLFLKEYEKIRFDIDLKSGKNYLHAFADIQVLTLLKDNPEKTKLVAELFKQGSKKELESIIVRWLDTLIAHPERMDLLLELPDSCRFLLLSDNAGVLDLYLNNGELFRPLLKFGRNKEDLVWNYGALREIIYQPEKMPAYIDILNRLPKSFPKRLLSRFVQEMLDDPSLADLFAYISEKAPKQLQGYELRSIEMLLENKDLSRSLLDQATESNTLLFNPVGFEYVEKHPEQLQQYVDLINNIPSDTPAFVLEHHLERMLSDTQLVEVVNEISQKALILWKNENSLDLYIKNYQILRPLIDKGDTTKEFLFESSALNYLVLHPELISSYIEFVDELPASFPGSLLGNEIERLLSIPQEKRRNYVEVLIQIEDSPSQEIQRLKSSLLAQIIETDNPVDAYKKIESIFIKNNLPVVGKVYKIFEVLYPTKVFKSKLRYESSPVLLQAGTRRRSHIIFQDLLKIHVESANRSLRQYIEVLKDGQSILETTESAGIENLNPIQQKQLKYFFDKLATLLANSSLGHNSSIDMGDQSSLKSRYENLKASLIVKPGQTVTSRISEMFLKSGGFDNFDQLLQKMQKSKEDANLRNLQLVEGSRDNHLDIAEGDLLKGVDERYIAMILQNGSVAKEFLGSAAQSDHTPFDTDVSRVSKEDAEAGFTTTLRNSLADHYGNLLLCVKDRGQFQVTSAISKDMYDPTKLELFNTLGGKHYGIRTGFGSTEIDFIIAKGELMAAPKILDKLYFEIAQNGYYIPVTDEAGMVIFTPELYKEYRMAFDGLSRFDAKSLEYIPTVSSKQTETALEEIENGLDKNMENVEAFSKQIRSTVELVLKQQGVQLKDQFDSSLIGAELFDTGSTGRQTNLPGGYDFDLNLRLDSQDFNQASQFAEEIKKHFVYNSDRSHQESDGYYQLRIMGVSEIDGIKLDTPIDIDIGFSKKSDLLVYASHDAIKEKLSSIQQNNGEEIYRKVIANILLAKQLLKQGNAYKKFEHGGFGGIGVENWILMNGGNLLEAFRTFHEAAYDNGQRLSFEQFQARYKLIDPGLNIKYQAHDNYIQLLKPEGYEAMLKVIDEYLKQV